MSLRIVGVQSVVYSRLMDGLTTPGKKQEEKNNNSVSKSVTCIAQKQTDTLVGLLTHHHK